MKKLCKLALVFTSYLLFYSAAYSTNIPNTDDPKTFLGPTPRVSYTSTIGNYTAYSVAGEAGLKNFRANGTLGWNLTEYQRFKISAEYLWQDITYAFFSSNTDLWVNQGALGAAYQYDLVQNRYHPQFEFTAYGSHAPSKSLSTVNGSYFNASGLSVPFTEVRRIAGSNANGVMPGLAFLPWKGGRVNIGVNYDRVSYNKKYLPSENVYGVGGTLGFSQAITDSIDLGLTAAVRQPFNNYAVYISWNQPYLGRWKVALFGDYNDGKNTLPDTYNVGISVDYCFDRRTSEALSVPRDLKGYRDLKAEVAAPTPPSDGLLAWTAKPAVYMPQVLAVVDPRVSSQVRICNLPPVTYIGLSSAALTNLLENNNIDPYDFGPSFTGSSLVYSMTVIASGGGNPADLSINPQTGEVSGFNTAVGIFAITVTATNPCGSRASIFFTYTLF